MRKRRAVKKKQNIVMMRGRATDRCMKPGINPTVKKPKFPIGTP